MNSKILSLGGLFILVSVCICKGSEIVDGDAYPSIPNGWTIREHEKDGKIQIKRVGDDLYLDGKKVVLYLSQKQEGTNTISGFDLREEFKQGHKTVFNATILDYLMAHQELIPDTWKQDEQGHPRRIFFWGTIYDDRVGTACVRYMLFDRTTWLWTFQWVVTDWSVTDPAVTVP